jgi:SAM-dependent methyltransferase
LRAFIELAGQGVIADLGCGPGHVTRFLAQQGADVIGLDLSPEMISIARERAPELPFTVGSMLDLPFEDGAWAGAVALYSIIHFAERERARAFREFARALRRSGWLLVSFHVDSPDFATERSITSASSLATVSTLMATSWTPARSRRKSPTRAWRRLRSSGAAPCRTSNTRAAAATCSRSAAESARLLPTASLAPVRSSVRSDYRELAAARLVGFWLVAAREPSR